MEEMVCSRCPRRCHALRQQETGQGFCRSGSWPRLARAALHHWEEPCISGTRGSGTVFFSGCSLGCVFCQNYGISHENKGKTVSPARLREIFLELIAQGAHNINLVNPTHYTHMLEEVLSQPLAVPVVYNTGGYDSIDALKRLEGKIDIYLPDLKLAQPLQCGRYLGAKDYFHHAAAAIQEMHRQCGQAVFDAEGMLQKGLLVRHLVLPCNLDQTYRVLDWLADNLPPDTPVSLMAQYLPMGEASRFPEINRSLTRREYDRAVDYLLSKGFTRALVQERSSAEQGYIPDFNMEGI